MSDESRQSIRTSELELALGGKYRILGKIGAGGFGEVYLGEHVQLTRKVAIKILLHSISTQQELVTRFQREARSAAALTHPNIIDIYDVGEGGGIYYFVMKYIDGETLSHKMQREKQMNPGEVIRIIQQLADALDYAHSNDVVHRDIKPANVMLDTYSKPMLMDFGVARVQYEGNLTKTGTLLGTPHYLAPEQPLGKPVDGRSDIYSLGIMFYEMLAGRPPFHDDNSITLIFKHINEPPPPLNSIMPDLDPELCLIVHKMIEKNPENRQQSAGEVAEGLHHLSTVYAAPVFTSVKRATSGGIHRNTEKLLLLAKEHLSQQKLDKAIEIYETIAKRNPGSDTARKEVEEILPKLVEKTKQHISTREFREARNLISHASVIIPDNPELKSVQQELENQEHTFNKNMETAFQEHFEAANVALQKNDAPSAMEHLTKAATLNSSSEQVQELMKQTEGRITSQINLLCESLDFTGARKMVDLGKQSFPELAKAKNDTIDRHRDLYLTLVHARENLAQQKWAEAADDYKEFLKAKPPYEFEIFNTLRKEAEESLEKANSHLGPGLVAAPVVKIEEPRATVAAKPAAGHRRMALILLLGALLAGGVYAVVSFMNRSADAPVAQPDLSAFNRLATKVKQDNAPLPTVGEISITSDPAGATVIIANAERGKTPLRLADVAFGKYKVELKLKGYKDLAQEVEVTANKPMIDMPVVMEAVVPVVGVLVIESDPPGAFIAMNNRVLGVTPRTLDKANVGRYNITLKKEGFLDYTETVRVKENETTKVAAKLAEIPKPVVVAPAPKPVEPTVKPGMLVQLGPDVVPPKPVTKTSPKYPDRARSQRLEGTVRLSILVSETGKVTDVKVTGSAHPILDDVAVKTVQEWVYTPATKQNVPVKVWISTSITFAKR